MLSDNDDDLYSETVTVGTEAPRVRSADELGAAIAAAKGKLTVSANSSNLIVALNNSLRFSVTRTVSGDYEITDRGDVVLLVGLGAAALLLVLIASR